MSVPICRSCSYVLKQKKLLTRAILVNHSQILELQSTLCNTQSQSNFARYFLRQGSFVSSKAINSANRRSAKISPASTIEDSLRNDVKAITADVEEAVNAIEQSERIPSEKECLDALRKYETAAKKIAIISEQADAQPNISRSTSVNASPAKSKIKALSSCQGTSQVATRLSELSYNLLCHSTVLISPSMLKIYVRTQCLLQQPHPFPTIFDLYARKPAPVRNTNPIQYKDVNPKKMSRAIPSQLAKMALETAFEVKDMQLSLDIVATTYRTFAFRRLKILRRASPIIIAMGLSPAALYIIATKIAAYQNTMDESLATAIAFTGMMAYLFTTSSLGLIAIGTSNDQMMRVSWIEGTPLRHRWMREDERAAVERIAMAFGFKEKSRWGEEEGECWKLLKEWAGTRQMIVDRVSLMEGME